jgi:hypothetical protein
MNYRWSQPGRTNRNRQDQLYDEGVFPFANVTTTDHSRQDREPYDRCVADHTCPLGMEIYSANEYWVKAASLLHTDPSGTMDLPDSPFTRNYFISSHQHGVGNGRVEGAASSSEPARLAPVQRALFVALDDWVDEGQRAAAEPGAALRTAPCRPLPQSGIGFPNIPGVTYNGLQTTRYLFDYGPNYDDGHHHNQPAGDHAAVPDNPANGGSIPASCPRPTATATTSRACAARRDGAARDLHRLGAACRAAAATACEGSGQMIPVREDESRAHRLRRPAAVDRGALSELHGVLLPGRRGGERLRRQPLDASGGRERDVQPDAAGRLQDRRDQDGHEGARWHSPTFSRSSRAPHRRWTGRWSRPPGALSAGPGSARRATMDRQVRRRAAGAIHVGAVRAAELLDDRPLRAVTGVIDSRLPRRSVTISSSPRGRAELRQADQPRLAHQLHVDVQPARRGAAGLGVEVRALRVELRLVGIRGLRDLDDARDAGSGQLEW